MARILDVYLHRKHVGQLIQDDYGEMVFDYTENWVNSTNAVPLSHSLPLRKARFTRHECSGFFAGILPEAAKRDMIARNLGISKRNDFSMLAEIGGECAGAVTFIMAGESVPLSDYHYRPLSDSELTDILKILPNKPLLAGQDHVRLSLAGAQDKIAVHVDNGKVSIPLGGAPSTHILKPAIKGFEGMVFNEAFCMQLAAAVNIPTATVSINQVQGIDYLLVERYDRTHDKQGNIHRLHQEDFCQALGIIPEMKYQNDGGPGLSQCMALLKNVSTTPVVDLGTLLNAIIFNLLIGNNDAHGKNFSLLYHGDTIRLAPAYDVLSTVYYPELAQKMAMRIGSKYTFEDVFPRHFEAFAEQAGLGVALVKKRVSEMAELVIETLDQLQPAAPVSDKLPQLIEQRCHVMLKRFRQRNNI